MNKDNLIEFAKEQCEIFPEDSYMGKYLRETLKMLQTEPCEDAISRSQTLKELEESAKHHANDSREEVLLRRDREIIRALPSVKPVACIAKVNFSKEDMQEIVDKKVEEITVEPRWIPVTEDAPPIGTICLWCNKQGSVFTSEITCRSESSSYVGKHGYFSNGLENYGDIVAWMPLPEPYQAEKGEE